MILECFEYNQHFVAMMNIINHARLTNLEGKFEKHHIIPKCFFRLNKLPVDNSSSNLVNLTFEEHKQVHKLAYLCAKDIVKNRLKHAMCFMNRESLSGRTLDKEWREKISLATKGENNPMYNRNYREMMDENSLRLHDLKISIRNKGKKRTNEAKERYANSKLGNKNPAFGKHWWTDGKINILSFESPIGFHKGKVKNK